MAYDQEQASMSGRELTLGLAQLATSYDLQRRAIASGYTMPASGGAAAGETVGLTTGETVTGMVILAIGILGALFVLRR